MTEGPDIPFEEARPMIVPPRCINCSGLHVFGRGAVCDSRCSTDLLPSFDYSPLSPCMRCEKREGCRECCDDRQDWLSCMGKLRRARRDMALALHTYSLGELTRGAVE